MKVLVIGELNVDLILDEFTSFPAIGKEVLAHKMNLTLGSSSAIFASNLSNLGNEVSFLGMTGKDYFGAFVRDVLLSHNVDISAILQSDHHPTGLTVILNVDEDRANVTYPGAMAHFSGNMIDLNLLKNFDHIHISSYFLQPALAPFIPLIFQKAKEYDLTTSFDMQWDPLETWKIDLNKILPYVDVFLPNEGELMAATRTDSLQLALGKIKAHTHAVAIKQGNRGSVVFSNGRQQHLNAYLNTKVVDAIGAGDSFNAGFIHKYIRRNSLRECQEYGNLTGAISTTKSGGTAALADIIYRENIARDLFNKVL